MHNKSASSFIHQADGFIDATCYVYEQEEAFSLTPLLTRNLRFYELEV